MSTYTKEKLKSVIPILLCCIFVGAAAFGIYKIVSTVAWTAQTKNYRREIAASMEYAESKYSMYITIDHQEPVRIHYTEVAGFHRYLVTTPQNLPANESKPGTSHAAIDCGDGSLIELWDAGPRKMRLRYRSAEGNVYQYTLRYYTEYDGWDFFVKTVSGEYIPG